MSSEDALWEWMKEAQEIAEDDGMSPIPGKGIEAARPLLDAALAEARSQERERVVFGLRWWSDYLSDSGEYEDETVDVICDVAWWLQHPDLEEKT